jgi:drug/metabolite transporter (DMT)-like permease
MLLVAFFSFLWAMIEWIGPAAGLPAEEIVWMRYATHLTVLTLCCWWRYRGAIVKTEHPWAQFTRSLLMLAMPLFFLGAMARMNPNTAMTVFWLAPLMLFAGDRKAAAAPINWIAVLAAYAGVDLLLWPSAPDRLRSLVFPAGMALCFAGYLIVTRRLREELEVTNLFYTAFWVLIAMTFRLPEVWKPPTVKGLVVGVLIGVAGLAGLYAVDLAVRTASPGTIGSAFYLQPVFARLIQILTQGVHPSARAIAGLSLVCAGVAVQLAVAAFSKTLEEGA